MSIADELANKANGAINDALDIMRGLVDDVGKGKYLGIVPEVESITVDIDGVILHVRFESSGIIRVLDVRSQSYNIWSVLSEEVKRQIEREIIEGEV